jgi:hypothetical protein
MNDHIETEAFFSNDKSQGKVTATKRLFANSFITIEYLNEGEKCLRIPIKHELRRGAINSMTLLRIANKLAKTATCPMTDTEIDRIVQEAATTSN